MKKLQILFFIFTVVDEVWNCKLILISFSFVHAKVVTGFDTKETCAAADKAVSFS